jgi:hypothetical protein
LPFRNRSEVGRFARGDEAVRREAPQCFPNLQLASSRFSRYYSPLIMANSDRFTIICPCCEATLNIDAETGALLSHEEKTKPLGSFEDMVKDLDKQKQTRDQMFAQEMTSFKDRSRLLEEKFQEAKKKAEKDTKIYRNPLDLD